ncbi:hypothetical protein [Streptomyces sp. NPDC050121]|uniref:hypothetical protein n=1 Tax=Streptomyces sp. NPDC050121 TaxID=3365601 RepID=UPI0037A4DD8C
MERQTTVPAESGRSGLTATSGKRYTVTSTSSASSLPPRLNTQRSSVGSSSKKKRISLAGPYRPPAAATRSASASVR